MIITLLAGGLLATSISLKAGQNKLFLVKDGKHAAPIIIPKNALHYTKFSADELAQYIEKISGARPKVIEGVPSPLPKPAIWVGYQPALKKLFPKTDFTFKHPEEILITANADYLAITGRDRWDPKNLDVADPETFIYRTKKKKVIGKQFEYGTANAVYTFMQDYLDVRWLWPGELGEDIIKKPTIAFAPFSYRYHPTVRSRGGLLHYSSLGDREHSGDWTRHQRLKLDSLFLPGGHAFGTWWSRYHKKYPDIFAMQPDGTRSGFPSPGYVKLCQSNPRVWDLWLEGVKEELKLNPLATTFNATPNDGYTSGICVCDNCRKWDNPDGTVVKYHWSGFSQEYVAMSDRYIHFANILARKLKKAFPDKDYYVLMAAYGNSRPAPAVEVPDKNVIVPHVSHFPWNEGRRELHKNEWRGWKKKGSPRMMYRPNTGSPVGWQQGMPEILTRKIIEDFKFLAEQNCVGIYIDAVWEHWSTQGPQFYLMAQLTWNPQADGNAIMDDYYKRGFGPAAQDIKAYWNLFENARDNYLKKHESLDYKKDKYLYSEIYTPELMAQAEKLLNQADSRVAKNSIYHKRINFIRLGLDYSTLMAENFRLMKKWKVTRDKATADKVRANWDKIKKIWAKDSNAFFSPWLKPTGPRMVGYHPDHMTFSRKKKPKLKTGLDLD